MFNEVEIDEYEDDELVSVFLKSFKEPCSEWSEVRTISLICCVFDHLITTFAHAHHGYSLYFLSKQKMN